MTAYSQDYYVRLKESAPGLPIHQVGITAIGLHLVDNMALGALADECATRSRWSFLFTLAPLRVEGGTGCPVNPVAVL